MTHARPGLALLLLVLACDPDPWSEPAPATQIILDDAFDLDPEAPLDLEQTPPAWPAP